MENRMNQYANSITRAVERATYKASKYLELWEEKGTLEKHLFRALNSTKNLCTPSYILRRQIEMVYKQELDDAAEKLGISIRTMSECENLPWNDTKEIELEKSLSKCLAIRMMEERGCKFDPNVLYGYLSGNKMPKNRTLFFKVIYAFGMDEETATKYLLACGQREILLKNPVDFIVLFFLKNRMVSNWEQVETVINQYITYVKETEDPVKIKQENGATMLLKRWMDEHGEHLPEEGYIPDPEELLSYMKENRHLFPGLKSKGQFFPGCSITDEKLLQELSSYLVLLYPRYHVNTESVEEVEQKIKVVSQKIKAIVHDTDSTKKKHLSRLYEREKKLIAKRDEISENEGNEFALVPFRPGSDIPDPVKLISAAYEAHQWYFVENVEVKQGFSDKSEKLKHDSCPFNASYMYIKEFPKKLRKIYNADTEYNVTKPVEKNDVLLMAYLFISGYLAADSETKEAIEEKAIASDSEIALCIQDVMERIDKISESNREYVILRRCLEAFLITFSFKYGLYLPLPFDRLMYMFLLSECTNGELEKHSSLFRWGYLQNTCIEEELE